jgi:hypothetical protein
LREYPGRHEIEIRNSASGNRPCPRENLPKDGQPQDRLYHPRQQFDRIMNKLADIGFSNCGHLLEKQQCHRFTQAAGR